VSDTATLHQVHIESLELIRSTCTSIETFELLIPHEHCNYALGDWPAATEAFVILDIHLRTILSPKEIIVNFEVSRM